MIHKTVSSSSLARRTPAPRLLLRVNFTPTETLETNSLAPLTPDAGVESAGEVEKTGKNSLREAMFGPSLLVFAFTTISHIGCHAKNWIGAQGAEDLAQPQNAVSTLLQAKVSARKTRFAVGEVVTLHLTVENRDEKAVALEFRSGQSFDFCATAFGSKTPLWRWSDAQRFSRALRSQSVAPGEKLRFEAIWEGAKTGKYAISGQLTADAKICAPIFEIEVV